MKQIKAIKKNGKPKKTEAKKLATILPEEYQEEGKTRFDDCYKKFQSKIKKESKCDSWVSFSKCFIGFAESVSLFYSIIFLKILSKTLNLKEFG